MLTFAAMLGLLAATDPVQAPVVGRPLDFSGAIGGPFKVTMEIDRTEVAVEEPFTLTLRIEGPGNLKEIHRPELGKLNQFREFAVENAGDSFADVALPKRTFQYTLRVRSPDTREVPSLRFVYFNPAATTVNRGFQTAIAAGVEIQINEARRKRIVVPDFVRRELDAERELERNLGFATWTPNAFAEETTIERLMRRIGLKPRNSTSAGAWIMFLWIVAPPFACGVWYFAWRLTYENRSLRQSVRRSRAAAVAMRRLKAGDAAGPILIEYLQTRLSFATTISSSADFKNAFNAPKGVDRQLKPSCDGDLILQTFAFLAKCEESAYGPVQQDSRVVMAIAERFVTDWEEAIE